VGIKRREKKSFAAIYQYTKNPTLLGKHTKNSTGFTPKSARLPGEGKRREKHCCSYIVGISSFDRIWRHAGTGRWHSGSDVPSISKLRDKVNTQGIRPLEWGG
jgi:hypothetical protein